ncbi:MAG: mechanosensitive ion channel family protein [Nostocaceae cyanobacterium]|nr:mechanosensitive ion channel family protein [Nostocaceae cyanobacterium]
MKARLKKRFRYWLLQLLVAALTVTIATVTIAQDVAPSSNAIDGTPVLLSGEELFVIQARVGSFSAAERAQAVTQRIEAFANNGAVPVESLKVEDQEYSTSIAAGDKLLFTITEADAKAAGKARSQLAREYTSHLQMVIQQYRQERSSKSILFGVLYTILATIALFILLKLLNRAFVRILTRRGTFSGTRLFALRIQNFELLSAAQIAALVTRLLKWVRLALALGLLAIYFTLVLSLFPWTKRLGATIVGHLLEALNGFWTAFLSYLPNLFIIAFIAVITYYVLRFTRFLFQQLGRDQAFPWFYPEWAEPTHKLATVLIIALAAVVAFPYLPGSKSPAFQGVSLFLGLLISLGSSSAISNMVAGVILIYTRAFKAGDRVKVGEAIGDVVEKTLLVTQLRTIKNVVITIPNSTVLNSQVINYSALSQTETPLILHTTVTLGYDVPWRKVHETLIGAAHASQHILQNPAPFVLQTSLDDFYVSYELNAYTNQPAIMAKIYSELHQNIQDKCNEVGIEILSPHYRAVRDGNQNTIPEDYLPSDYVTPRFRIDSLGDRLIPPNGKPNQPDEQAPFNG